MRATPHVRGHALERHHRGRAGILGDLRLLGVDHVHDHAALEHLGQAGLDAESGLVSHRAPQDSRGLAAFLVQTGGIDLALPASLDLCES
jgi:hypothetical protein